MSRVFAEIKTLLRAKKKNIKEKIIEEKGFHNLRLLCEDVAELDYQPKKCERADCFSIY